MKCPHHPHDLEFQAVENHRGHVCPECRGIWLTAANLHCIGETRRHDPAGTRQELERTQPRLSTLRCPLDNRLLLSARLGALPVEWCPACAGIWFDRMELQQFMQSLAAANPPPAKGASRVDKAEAAVDAVDVLEALGDILTGLLS